LDYLDSIRDFRKARRQASMERILARLTGRSADLLPYEVVRTKLRAKAGRRRGPQDIPLDAIVGSVGRYSDFTRRFLPRQDSDQERWARVSAAVSALEGLPPIEVYRIGDAYFVRDGNHRVSVARQLDASHIQAYVTEVATSVPFSPDVQPDDLIIKAEYAGFLERTKLDIIRPTADMSVTVPGRYGTLLEHIDVHRYFMGLNEKRDFSYGEAVASWYDEVYLPVVHMVRERAILREFPDRTETDIYLWASEHRAELEKSTGWEIDAQPAVEDLAIQKSGQAGRVVARVSGRIVDAITPDELEAGPSPGRWREERLAARREDLLFADILVPVGGNESGWSALDQALAVAGREGARLQGLHVVPSPAQAEGTDAHAIAEAFAERCRKAGIPGRLRIVTGKVARTIADRARWSDLVVANLAHPPGEQPLDRLGSGFRTLLLRTPRPVLAVRGVVSSMGHALLAYDGSRKAEEALFVASYLGGRWVSSLTVIVVEENRRVDADRLDRARSYLEGRGVTASYVEAAGPIADAILETAETRGCDLILMGGYGHGPVLEVMIGSTVDQVLRESGSPVLVCR
jgi:nucleotide-binding universal stress UspA family protein